MIIIQDHALKESLNKDNIRLEYKLYGINTFGKNFNAMGSVTLGFPSVRVLNEARQKNVSIEDYPFIGVKIGDDALIRPYSTIYCDFVAGNNFQTGHNTLIREMTVVGDNVRIGTNTIVDGNAVIGNNVSIQSNVYIPTNTVIEDNVFMGPCAVLTNDKYPIRIKYDLKGPVLRKGASIGANSTILPGVDIGEGAMVAAGALVTRDVPAWSLAIGFPAKITSLPGWMKNYNRI